MVRETHFTQLLEPMGPKIRRQRRRLGLTLDELAGRSGISKPYLSLIETQRVPNPPSDEKLRRIEQSLGFSPGELRTQAHLERTPPEVRAVLGQLLSAHAATGRTLPGEVASLHEALLRGFTQEWAGAPPTLMGGSVGCPVPVINLPTGGYPQDFMDADYPRRVAREFCLCPDMDDPRAFAVRVQGDGMAPRYQSRDIVIFSPNLPRRNGDDCFIRFADGQTTFQQVFFDDTQAPVQSVGSSPMASIRLQPRNEKYRPQLFPPEKIIAIYRAVSKYVMVE